MLFYLGAIPMLAPVIILQSVVVSKIHLLYGSANLILLVVLAWAVQENTQKSYSLAVIGGLLYFLISAAPVYIPLATFLLIVFITKLVRTKLWRMPILVMILMSIIGTIIEHLLTIFTIQFFGTLIPFSQSISAIILPSALLNLLVALPVYAIITDVARLVYPVEIEI
jgi:cell shape-determining protein MreD